jgi:Smg protein
MGKSIREVVTMFEILMFLFENFMDGSVTLKADNDVVVNELQRIGFDRHEIDRALDWIDGLHDFQQAVQSGPQITSYAIRHYLPEEVEQMGIAGIELLTHLQRLGIVDPFTREAVIDRAMALDVRGIDIRRLRWLVLMVLFHQPDKKAALFLLQEMMLADASHALH